MGLDLDYINGQTPLDEEEKEGLLIPTIATREELDEFEQQNVEEAIQWLIGKSFKPEKVLTEKFICDVHERMFNQVWKWAGSFRHSQKNIGVDYWNIPMELNNLIEDAKVWLQDEVFSPDEFAIRFKHRIVSIHCFSNGNGRHSRLMADIIIEKLFDLDHFTWGDGDLSNESDTRSEYLKALKEADKGSLDNLLKFARS
ncbi:mobile mystery protein B [Ekhidna sp.]|uniref:mobile mystery protein B n=1 Tax=Ekhidna sp. TaxID=2608089 RepID=UPI003B596CF4